MRRINSMIVDHSGTKFLMNAYDVNGKDGIFFYSGEVVEDRIMDLIAEILAYIRNNIGRIIIVIQSPGGSVTAGLALIDFLRSLEDNEVYTVSCGLTASMGAVISTASAKKGNRYVLENTTYMIHQPSGGANGQSTDVLIQAERIEKTRSVLNKILAEATNKTVEEINNDTERDLYLYGQEIIDYGLADKIGFPEL